MNIFQSIKEAHRADLHNNTEKVVLSIIADSIGEHGECWLDRSTLAEWAHRSESAIWRATANLQRTGHIVIVPLFRPYWNGAQAGNGYILTAVADTPEKVEAAKSVLLARRWRDGGYRDNAMGGVAVARPLEVSPRSGPSNSNGEIRESGYAAPSSDSGEDEPQLQQPTDAAPDAPTSTTIAADTTTTEPTETPAQHDAVTPVEYAWIDVFGELSDPRTVKFISNAVRGNSADEVLRALALAKGQLEKGKEIAAPAAYVKSILTNRMNEYGAGHRTAKQPPAAGHRNHVDWAAVADQTDTPFDQAALDAEMERTAQEREAKRQEREAERERRAAEAEERQRMAAEQDRIRRDNEQMERARRAEASAAERANRHRQDIAKRIAAAIEAPDQAGRMAADFLSATPDQHMQNMRLDMLTIKRNRAGAPLAASEVTAILHGGLNAAAPARVMA